LVSFIPNNWKKKEKERLRRRKIKDKDAKEALEGYLGEITTQTDVPYPTRGLPKDKNRLLNTYTPRGIRCL
jgi:hypothetical protein